MSAPVLLNLLNEMKKSHKMRGLPSILSLFFATSLILSIKQEYECKILLSYDIKTILKSHLWHENVRILPNL